MFSFHPWPVRLGGGGDLLRGEKRPGNMLVNTASIDAFCQRLLWNHEPLPSRNSVNHDFLGKVMLMEKTADTETRRFSSQSSGTDLSHCGLRLPWYSVCGINEWFIVHAAACAGKSILAATNSMGVVSPLLFGNLRNVTLSPSVVVTNKPLHRSQYPANALCSCLLSMVFWASNASGALFRLPCYHRRIIRTMT